MTTIIWENIKEEQEENYNYLLKLLSEDDVDLDNLNKYLSDLFKKENSFKDYLFNKLWKEEYQKIIDKITVILWLYQSRFDKNISKEVWDIKEKVTDLLKLLKR